jgi:hypothetical protein
MRNGGVGRVLSVPYRTVTAAIVSLPKRLGAVRGYSAGAPNPGEAVLGRARNQYATVPVRQNTTSYPTPVAGCLIASKSP